MKLLFGLALAASAIFVTAAAAQDTPAQPATPPPAADQIQAAIQAHCHHDGEVLLTANGPVVCHLKHPTGVTNYSREWFREQQLRSASMNH
ncbi:MAG TPA: hypothetical protein VMH86_08765 [Rhizomicrobium sp.]|nr:hypothetical protein [Rhizomicrobium sp.]